MTRIYGNSTGGGGYKRLIEQILTNRLDKFFVYGEREPMYNQVMWFDTSGKIIDAETVVTLLLGGENDVSDVLALIDGTDYPVMNASNPVLIDEAGNTYEIEILN